MRFDNWFILRYNTFARKISAPLHLHNSCYYTCDFTSCNITNQSKQHLIKNSNTLEFPLDVKNRGINFSTEISIGRQSTY